MRENVSSLNNVSLSDFCTYHTGGKASSIKIVYDIDGLIETAVGDYTVIGCGSKLLISDEGYDGKVILMRLSGIKLTENGVYAYAGVPLPALSRFCEANSLDGLAWACGIPGSVGGAIKLNAGAFGNSISDHIGYVEVLENGKILKLSKDELDFKYRNSNIDSVVVGAEFDLQRTDEDLSLLRKKYFSIRRASQPRGFSCGSVFKNADKPAGWYIEQAGLKGLVQGGAIISEKHANFIINTGFASSRDIYTLIRTIKAEVKSKFGVSLQEEVIYLGEF